MSEAKKKLLTIEVESAYPHWNPWEPDVDGDVHVKLPNSQSTFVPASALSDLPEPSIREQIEALPVGARFIAHFEDGRQYIAWRCDHGWARLVDLPGGWRGTDDITRIEVGTVDL